MTQPYYSKEEIEKLFDEKFVKEIHGFECEGCCIHDEIESLKSFIQTIRAQDRQAIREFVQVEMKQVCDTILFTTIDPHAQMKIQKLFEMSKSDICKYLDGLEKQ